MFGTGIANALFGLVALLCYAGATVLYVVWLRHPQVSAGRTATLLAGTGAVCNFGFLYVRSLALKTVPYSDLLGSMALFGLFLAAMSLILEARHHDRSLGPFLMPVSLFFLLHSFLLPGGTSPPPEMRGSIFAFHVTLNMLSYSAFAVACALSLLYLVLGRQLKSRRHVLNGPVARLPFYLWVFVRAHRGAAPGTTARLAVLGFVLVLLSYTAGNLFFSKVH